MQLDRAKNLYCCQLLTFFSSVLYEYKWWFTESEKWQVMGTHNLSDQFLRLISLKNGESIIPFSHMSFISVFRIHVQAFIFSSFACNDIHHSSQYFHSVISLFFSCHISRQATKGKKELLFSHYIVWLSHKP